MTSSETIASNMNLPHRRILIVNPNSTARMTGALKPLCEGLGLSNTTFTFFTGPPDSPKSINDDKDCYHSADCCFPLVTPILPNHDAVLIACYSEHPLVPMLKEHCLRKYRELSRIDRNAANTWRDKAILGIFEASILNSWEVLKSISTCFTGSQNLERKWGIITTGKVWESLLTDGVWRFFVGNAQHPKRLEGKSIQNFAGVGSTGLNATELHDLPPDVVRAKMLDAVKKLLQKHLHDGGEDEGGKIGAMCLGCAGMVGLGDIIEQAAVEVGYEPGELKIVDGVKAGVLILDGVLRAAQS